MAVTTTDAVLWYNVGVFGEEGYGVPNPSDDVGTNNPNIADLVKLMGRNLFTVMHHEDAMMRTPPSINTLLRMHKLYVRLGQILTGRAVPPGKPNFEMEHVKPAGEVFLVYPVPYFKVRNPFMRRWAGLILAAISEAMQHTENVKGTEISTLFAGRIGAYAKRVYVNMAVELFGKELAAAEADGFLLADADFTAYNPAKYFTGTEMVDTVPRLDRIFTEDLLAPLSEGIPVTSLPALQPWPTNLQALTAMLRGNDRTASDDAIATGAQPGAAASSSSGQPAPIVPASTVI